MPSSHLFYVVDICAAPVSNVSELAGILYQYLTDHHHQHWKNQSWNLLLSHWNMSLTWCGSYLVMCLTDTLLAVARLLFQLRYCLQLALIDIDPMVLMLRAPTMPLSTIPMYAAWPWQSMLTMTASHALMCWSWKYFFQQQTPPCTLLCVHTLPNNSCTSHEQISYGGKHHHAHHHMYIHCPIHSQLSCWVHT